MGVHRGANLVGMSLLPLDSRPSSWFNKKKWKDPPKMLLQHVNQAIELRVVCEVVCEAELYDGLE